jgi:hypothetical protein
MRAPVAIAVVLAAFAQARAEPLPPPLTDQRVPEVVLDGNDGWRLTGVSGMEVENGVVILIVEGDVINSGTRERAAPKIRLALRDKDAREIYFWTVATDAPRVKPADWVTFKARLERPPEDAYSVEIRAVDQD